MNAPQRIHTLPLHVRCYAAKHRSAQFRGIRKAWALQPQNNASKRVNVYSLVYQSDEEARGIRTSMSVEFEPSRVWVTFFELGLPESLLFLGLELDAPKKSIDRSQCWCWDASFLCFSYWLSDNVLHFDVVALLSTHQRT